jgi:hypothetical protein
MTGERRLAWAAGLLVACYGSGFQAPGDEWRQPGVRLAFAQPFPVEPPPVKPPPIPLIPEPYRDEPAVEEEPNPEKEAEADAQGATLGAPAEAPPGGPPPQGAPAVAPPRTQAPAAGARAPTTNGAERGEAAADDTAKPAPVAGAKSGAGRRESSREAPSPPALEPASAPPVIAAPAVPDEIPRRFPIVSVQVGGGILTFTRPDTQGVGDGPYWDARVVIGTRKFLAFEVAYVGGAHQFIDDRYGAQALLVRSGLETNARINFPLERGAGLVLLYGVAGLGLSHDRLVNADVAGAVEADTLATVPLGGGLAIGFGRMLLDLRVTYRLTYRDDLLSPGPDFPDFEEGRFQNYTLGAQIGYEF